MPNAVYEPNACIRASLEAARRVGFPHRQIMFEFTENERSRDIEHLKRIVAAYRRQGFLTALDDFGAGFAGLSLLANFQPDLIKIDMDVLRGLDADARRRTIVAGIVGIARSLGIAVLAEGIETAAELETVRSLGVSLVQGYHFARPLIETLPAVATIALPGRVRMTLGPLPRALTSAPEPGGRSGSARRRSRGCRGADCRWPPPPPACSEAW